MGYTRDGKKKHEKKPRKPKQSTLTEQYNQMKEKHPDAVLLFRVGDFYESYFHDAVTVSETLGITLTKRSDDVTEMAGFPHHALDTYLPKLTRAGLRVAICDQLEQPEKTTKRGKK
jgi:DNA mismatch repair protein MutS